MIKLSKEMPAEVLVTTPASAQTSCNEAALNGAVANNSSTAAGIASTQRLETDLIDINNTAVQSQTNSNNTISAAADSSDNQPSSPQLHRTTAIEDTATQNPTPAQQAYAGSDVYGNTASANAMYSQHGYSQANLDLQQQLHQQQLHQHSSTTQYPSFLQTYHQFYQQQQQQQQNPTEVSSQSQHTQQMEFGNSHTNTLFSTSTATEAGVHYHQYGCNPAAGITTINSQNSNSNNAVDTSSQPAPVISVATSSVTSPRVGSSSSPSSSNQMQVSGRASSMSVGNPGSPNSAGSLQCKKCGVMFANDVELQEHITSVHGASPYGSSGYASSPYIKEELQQQTPPSQSQQLASAGQQTAAQGVNIGEILDLDSQKLLYPSVAGTMTGMIHANPLHGLHNMQQRAGINTWDQQAQEGLPPYMQQQANTETKNVTEPFYQPTKQSPYATANSSPVIKTEYTGETQQTFDAAVSNQQQHMMPPAVSSSPSEFPSTTTGGPQDNQQQNVASNQQFRGGSFEPPSSSSSSNMPTGSAGTKAANWKSNEARRPKTYNCTACNKWFTSSGHLKRHYNTTLHKNAVKSSGQPDPATLPISAHHHPARDPNGKTSRGRGANAAANAANNNAQQQQQPPNPVQPPEPPNSPQGYGGSQVAALTHFTASASPNDLYEHHQYSQHQYVSQVQSTTNNAPSHHTSSVSNLQNQQQQTALNGHPNELAGLSVPATVYQHQAPMPSSPMRGLLNTTTPLLTATATEAKMQQLETAVHEREVEDFDYLSKVEVKREYLEKMEEEEEEEEVLYQQDIALYPLKVETQESERDRSIQQQLQSVETLRDHNAEHAASQQIHHYQPDPAPLEDMPTSYHNITLNNTHNMHSNTLAPLHPTTSHPQQQHHQMQDLATYTLIQAPPQLQQLNTAEQHYINMPSATNMPPSNMLQLQPQPTTTEQQQPAITIPTPTPNMVSIQPPNQHTQLPPLQHMELQPQANMSLQLDTINTNTQLQLTTTISSTSMPLYHQQLLPDSEPPQLERTQTCQPTIIGNNDGSLTASPGQKDTVTPTGQLVQILPLLYPVHAMYHMQPFSDHLFAAEKSPSTGDVPYRSYSLSTTPSSMASSPTLYQSDSSEMDDKEFILTKIIDNYLPNGVSTYASPCKHANNFSASYTASTATANKRSRKSSSSSSAEGNSIILPSGRIRCVLCDKEFTKICYFTQHNNSFHSGEYPFRCQKCGKRYQMENTYTKHLSRHKTIDKDHKCLLCPKQFHHKTDLRRHIEAIHTGNKQHACQVCGKSFCRKDHLRKHIQTHSRTRAVPKRAQTRGGLSSVPKHTSRNQKLHKTQSSDNKLSRATTSPPMQPLEDCVPAENVHLLLLEDMPFDSHSLPTQQLHRQSVTPI